jgi:hypothetical protein
MLLASWFFCITIGLLIRRLLRDWSEEEPATELHFSQIPYEGHSQQESHHHHKIAEDHLVHIVKDP